MSVGRIVAKQVGKVLDATEYPNSMAQLIVTALRVVASADTSKAAMEKALQETIAGITKDKAGAVAKAAAGAAAGV